MIGKDYTDDLYVVTSRGSNLSARYYDGEYDLNDSGINIQDVFKIKGDITDQLPDYLEGKIDNDTIKYNSTFKHIYAETKPLIEGTDAELQTLISNSELVPGIQYKIMDFQT